MPRLLITGGAGKVAALLRPRIASPDRTVRLFDIVPVTSPLEGEEVVVGSLTSFKEVKEAVEGVDAIIHFGGQSRESSFDDVMQANLVGTHNLFEAAREAGITRIVMASSNHAAGFHTRSATPLPAEAPGRADTVYGWSKVAMEAMGSLYADRFGLDVICLRIGLWFHVPPGLRGLAMWLSPDDGARLIEAALSCEKPGFRIVWGISRNTRRWWSLAEGEAIGYFPQDDAEDHFAEQFIAEFGTPDFDDDPILNRVGGQWCDIPLGEPY